MNGSGVAGYLMITRAEMASSVLSLRHPRPCYEIVSCGRRKGRIGSLDGKHPKRIGSPWWKP